MKKNKNYAALIGAFAMVPTCLSAAIFTTSSPQGALNGTIIDASGTLLGTWSATANGTTGFSNSNLPDEVITGSAVDPASGFGGGGGSGIDFSFANLVGGNDLLALQFTIIPAAGFALDSVSIGQSIFNNSSGSNGGTGTNPVAPTASILGYTGAFTANLGTGGQINAPAIIGGDLVYTQAVQPLNNTDDDFLITLLDVNAAGDTVDFQIASESNVFREFVSFDATFSQIPEPSSTALLGLGLAGFLVRRKR